MALKTRIGWLATMCLLFVLLAGCAANRPVLYYEDPETKDTVKRVPRYGEIDYFHHWRSVCYRENEGKARAGSSEDKAIVLEALGQPEYIRVPFISQYNENTVEWIYTEQDMLFQFVGGEMVHAQAVTDIERVWIVKGYPDFYISSLEDWGKRRQTLIYRDYSGSDVELYSFSDGVMATRTE
ncbi:hypothetical protein HQ520_15330 [bacterium]|nr:hypothetical protein [bacterium]